MSVEINPTEELQKITKNRMRLSLTLIMITEFEKVQLDELMRLTGYTFKEINSITNNLVRLRLIEVNPTMDLPIFTIINRDDAQIFLKLMEENFYLDALE